MNEFIMYHLYKFANNKSFNKTLNIGAYDCHNKKFPDPRTFFKSKEYLGVDLMMGNYVDKIVDITKPNNFKDGEFDCIICTEVLEHIPNPWVAAKEIIRMLADDGRLFVSVPFLHTYHDYPGDYWRMTESGLDELFRGLERVEHYKEGNPNNPNTVICTYKKAKKK